MSKRRVQREFTRMFEKYRERVVTIAQGVTWDRAKAEDAVQAAAEYVLKRIEAGTLKKVTPSYFIQLCTTRAKNISRDDRRREIRVLPIGTIEDDTLSYAEEREYGRARGRRIPARVPERDIPDGPRDLWCPPAKPAPVIIIPGGVVRRDDV